PHWSTASDESGARRLNNPTDFVRVEIESALQRDVRVIPILVDGAQMPKASELPESLQSLATRNAVRIVHDKFAADVAGLVCVAKQARVNQAKQLEIDRWKNPPNPSADKGTGCLGLIVGAVIALIVAAIFAIFVTDTVTQHLGGDPDSVFMFLFVLF